MARGSAPLPAHARAGDSLARRGFVFLVFFFACLFVCFQLKRRSSSCGDALGSAGSRDLPRSTFFF